MPDSGGWNNAANSGPTSTLKATPGNSACVHLRAFLFPPNQSVKPAITPRRKAESDKPCRH